MDGWKRATGFSDALKDQGNTDMCRSCVTHLTAEAPLVRSTWGITEKLQEEADGLGQAQDGLSGPGQDWGGEGCSVAD